MSEPSVHLVLSDPGAFTKRRFDLGPERDETEPLHHWQARALTETGLLSDAAWEPTRWWRVVLPDGSVWAESSNETEIRHHAADKPGATVQRLMERSEQRWEDA